jgi:hypothetical protein
MSYQQYQQPQYGQSMSTAAMEWNGSAWVPVAHNTYAEQPRHQTVVYSEYSSQFASAPAPVAPPISNTTKSPVELYTEYYHGWQAAMKHYERLPPVERQRNMEWARYYADESSRAAHHYYQTPNVTPPFDLPPAPPAFEVSTSVSVATSPSAITSTSSTNDRPTTSLTSYVKRCLDQCSTQDQRRQVQAQVEQCIARAIQANELHTKDWSQEPLISVVGVGHGPTVSGNNSVRDQSPSGGFVPRRSSVSSSISTASYYGPAGTTTSDTRHNPSPSTTTTKNNNNNNNNNIISNHHGLPAHHSTHTSFVAPSSPSFSSSYYGPASSMSPTPSASTTTTTWETTYSRKQPKNHSKKRPSPRSANNDLEALEEDGMDRSSRALLKRQARFFVGTGTITTNSGLTDLRDYSKYMGLSTINGGNSDITVKAMLTEEDYERMTVKGVCQTLEKDYLRLTAPPNPEMVRSESILRQHLHNLSSSSNDDTTGHRMYASKDYLWMCSQYKALRQDLTIQRIQNDLAVAVYEAHARLALREGDLNEFNQCQTQLPDLYLTNPEVGARDEFRAYRLLYHVYLTTTIAKEHAAAALEINKSLAIVNPGPALQHALDIRLAVYHHDYGTFFRLHEQAPHLGKYLTDRMVPTMRFRALKMIIKAYRPSLEFDHCQLLLGFIAGWEDGQQPTQQQFQQQEQKCQDFLKSCGVQVEKSTTHGWLLLTKESDGQIHEPATEVTNSLLK